jgi:tRNA(fMet)-specific endonuclease VapC
VFLLDTNICIYTISGRLRHVVDKLKSYEPPLIKLSSVSVGELEYGASKSAHREKNRIALLHFLSAFDIVDFNDKDAEVFGIIRANLEKEGQIMGPYDLQIAAQAITRGLVLVTNNVKEFERIKGLRIENWAAV